MIGVDYSSPLPIASKPRRHRCVRRLALIDRGGRFATVKRAMRISGFTFGRKAVGSLGVAGPDMLPKPDRDAFAHLPHQQPTLDL